MKGAGPVEVGLGATPVEAAEPPAAGGATVGAEVGAADGAVGVKTEVVVETGVWVEKGPLVTVTVWLGVAM